MFYYLLQLERLKNINLQSLTLQSGEFSRKLRRIEKIVLYQEGKSV